jgi:hypothetical protein
VAPRELAQPAMHRAIRIAANSGANARLAIRLPLGSRRCPSIMRAQALRSRGATARRRACRATLVSGGKVWRPAVLRATPRTMLIAVRAALPAHNATPHRAGSRQHLIMPLPGFRSMVATPGLVARPATGRTTRSNTRRAPAPHAMRKTTSTRARMARTAHLATPVAAGSKSPSIMTA